MRRRLIRGVLGCAVAVGAVAACPVAQGAPNPEPRATAAATPSKIIFQTPSSRPSLRIVTSSGRRVRTIEGPRGGWIRPAFSPDGRRIAAVNRRAIWVMNARGRKARRLVKLPGRNIPERLSWSPDGRQIAYTILNFPGPRGLFAVNVRTRRIRTLLRCNDNGEPCGDAESAAWSPDGRTIALEDGFRLLSVPARGGSPRVIFQEGYPFQGEERCQKYREEDADRPSWSSDGRLYFRVRVHEEKSAQEDCPLTLESYRHLFRSNGDGSNREDLGHELNVDTTAYDVSPDGSTVLLGRFGPGYRSLALLDVASGERTPLGQGFYPDW